MTNENAELDKDTDRLEAFSDGIFAVALTLLVVSLAVPEIRAGRTADAHELLHALAVQWPQFVAFSASFFSVLLLWISHHQTFVMIRKASRHLMLANGLLLFFVTLIPFTTAVLARYILAPGASIVALLYASVFLLITATFILIWHVLLSGKDLLHGHITDEHKRAIQRSNTLGLIPYIVACIVACWQPFLTVAICIALSVFWVVRGSKS